MADEHIKQPSPQVPAGVAPVKEPAAPAPATAPPNGQPSSAALAPPAPAPSLLHKVLGFIWPPSNTPGHAHQTESVREVVETIVFVVVLVLLLKSFAAEAFVIPTGSMAPTLYGYQKIVECPECHELFPVNCSAEVDPQDGQRRPVIGCTCPNCRYHIDFEREHMDPPWNSGDRVLVAKSLWETHLMAPERHDVVVFKFPGDDSFPLKGPQQNHVPMNYIKRLIGLPGETIGIHYGKLYVMRGDEPDARDREALPTDLWKRQYMHRDKFKELLEKHQALGEGKTRFTIIRKRPDKALALRRPVYDNDHPAKDLVGKVPPRWAGEGDSDWAAHEPNGFRHPLREESKTAWLRYRHLLRPLNGQAKPELITDFVGYNTYETPFAQQRSPAQNWVGDLMLECDVAVEQPTGNLVLELSKGVDRFRASWDLSSGVCTLSRSTPGESGEKKLGDARATALKGKGTYRLRFANFDERLTVWVNGSLPFGDGVEYEAARELGPRAENDLQPASIGVQGAAVTVTKLKLWRDTYYTLRPGEADKNLSHEDWSDPGSWGPLNSLEATTFFVQPNHYLCLGDNSPESSDSRAWGEVPDRLMLGRALGVYYPFYCPVWPLSSPVNRVGPIK
jgi:signal peptidase I